MDKILTTKDYDNISWHDNVIHSISMIDENWESDLILGIDYITKWICSDDNTCQFMVAPAKLVFHNVESLELNIKKPGLQQQSYLGMIIDEIIKEKTLRKSDKLNLWTFKFCDIGDAKENFKLSFVSSGFTQTLLKEPILKDEQSLMSYER